MLSSIRNISSSNCWHRDNLRSFFPGAVLPSALSVPLPVGPSEDIFCIGVGGAGLLPAFTISDGLGTPVFDLSSLGAGLGLEASAFFVGLYEYSVSSFSSVRDFSLVVIFKFRFGDSGLANVLFAGGNSIST